MCLIGIALFLGITAYDSQKIGQYYVAYQGDSAMLQRASIFSALQLYLDFINLFLYLLRFLPETEVIEELRRYHIENPNPGNNRWDFFASPSGVINVDVPSYAVTSRKR